MNNDFDQIQQDFQNDLVAVQDAKSLEDIRIKYLGKKGLMPKLYQGLGQLSADERPAFGQKVNALKQLIEAGIKEKQQQAKSTQAKGDALDVTIPGVRVSSGHQHLLTQTLDEICSIFKQLGFVLETGPEVESEFHNFTALNIPLDHPSRDSFDTFYLEQKDPDEKDRHLLLRSHTSPGQIRIMKEHEPPLAVIIPGKVYRPDAVDASHSFMFHQIEGLLVDQNVTFSDLKGLLTVFCQRFFGKDVKMRFRPHYFPFTEPSAEVDIQSNIFKGKEGKWLEILGCGMVHPKVFEAAGYPKGKYTGLAFGLGVERIAMLKHGIGDIRVFFENDQRFLRQF